MRAMLMLVALALSASPASAQGCLGNNVFSNGRIQAGASVASSDRTLSYGAMLAFGRAHGEFAGTHLSVNDIEGVEEPAYGSAATVGYAWDVGAARRVHLCPLLSVAYLRLNDYSEGGLTADVGVLSYGIGGAFGFTAAHNKSLAVLPALAVRLTSRRTDIELEDAAGWHLMREGRETHGQMTVALGVVLRQVLTVRPSLLVPVGLEGGRPSVGLDAAVSLSRPGPALH